jgi:hypothetical protein
MEEATGEKNASELLGAGIDVENYSEEDQAVNVANVNLSIGGEAIFGNVKDFQATVNVGQELLAIQMANETDGNIMFGLQGSNLYEKKPITGYVEVGQQADNQILCSLIINEKTSSGETVMYMLEEGNAKLKKFSKEKVVLEINGTVKEMKNMSSDGNTKEISGEIVLERPILTSMGMKINDVLY